MSKIIDLVKRNIVWILIGLFGCILLNPASPEIKTMFIVLVVESLAIALSGVAVYAYTNIDFTKDEVKSNLGLIFLAVHICVGLVILGVYIAQMGF